MKMQCPECDHRIEDKDLEVNAWDMDIVVTFKCPDCEHESMVGFTQEDLE